jgi:hypothetical protein
MEVGVRVRGSYWFAFCVIALALAGPVAAQGVRPHFDTFRAVVGADDEGAGTPDSVCFEVWLDGVKALATDVMRPLDPAKSIEVLLGDAKELMLVITDGGDTIANDRADWADARLVDSKTGAVVWLSDLPWRKEGEWITTVRDRNILKNPILLNGKVYPKGLGGFALMKLVWSDWDRIVAGRLDAEWEQEAKLRAEHGEPALHVAHPPTGLESVAVDGRLVWSKGDPGDLKVDLAGRQEIVVTAVQAGQEPPSSPNTVGGVLIETADGATPVSALTPDRVELLAGVESEGPRVVLNGIEHSAAFGAGARVRLAWRNPLTQVLARRGLDSRSAGDSVLFVEGAVGLDRENATGAGSVVFRLFADGELAFDSGLVTGAAVVPIGRVGINEGSDLLLVVEDAGDGGYEDHADWADLVISDGLGKHWGCLTDFEIDTAEQVWHGPVEDAGVLGTTIDIGGQDHPRGLGACAPSRIRYRKIAAAIDRRNEAMGVLQDSRSAWDRGDADTAIELGRKSIALDDGEPKAYTSLATMLEASGSKEEALHEWRRILEIARPQRKEINRARKAIERLYAELYPTTPSNRIPKDEPPLMGAGGRTQALGDLAAGIRSIEIGRQTVTPDTTVYSGEGRFRVGKEEAGRGVRFLVNSRGLTVTATLVELSERGGRWPTVTAKPAVNPSLEWVAAEGLWAIEITHDSRRDGYESPFTVWCMADLGEGGKPPITSESWTYRGMLDGSARCEAVVDGPDVIALPLSATALAVEGAEYYVGPPAYEYGSRLAWPYDASKLLSVMPTGGTATVRFTFPDGAMNVPMTRWGGPRDRNCYFRSLSPVNPGLARCRVRFYPTDGTSKIIQTAPAQYERDGEAFVWDLPYDKAVTVEAENAQVASPYITRQYRNLTSYVPKAPYYETWADEHIRMVAGIWDALAAVVDWEPDEDIYVSVPDPAQLPGYGGATWSDRIDGKRVSESWIPVRGQLSEYGLRYRYGASGIKTHELHWAFMGGLTPEIPDWLREMMSAYMELVGRLGGNGPFDDIWPREEWQYARRARDYFARHTEPGDGYLWVNDEQAKNLSDDDRTIRSAALCWMAQEIERRYGPRFWGRFWEYERDHPKRFADLDERAKTIAAVEDMALMSGSPDEVKKLFSGWTCDLAPDARYGPDRYLPLSGMWRFHPGDDPAWADPAFDDSAWTLIEVPSCWEEVPEYAMLDGYGWYRVRFRLPEGFAVDRALLWLGKIDDADEAYINGVRIGSSGRMPPDFASDADSSREYAIGAGVLRASEENVLAVRVYDGGGPGGIWVGPVAIGTR